MSVSVKKSTSLSAAIFFCHLAILGLITKLIAKKFQKGIEGKRGFGVGGFSDLRGNVHADLTRR